MAIFENGKAEFRYTISDLINPTDDIVRKINLSRNQLTIQVICEDLDSDIIVSLHQTNYDRYDQSTPVEDRQNEDPIILTLGNGSYSIIANTLYCEYAHIIIDKNLATTGRVQVNVVL